MLKRRITINAKLMSIIGALCVFIFIQSVFAIYTSHQVSQQVTANEKMSLSMEIADTLSDHVAQVQKTAQNAITGAAMNLPPVLMNKKKKAVEALMGESLDADYNTFAKNVAAAYADQPLDPNALNDFRTQIKGTLMSVDDRDMVSAGQMVAAAETAMAPAMQIIEKHRADVDTSQAKAASQLQRTLSINLYASIAFIIFAGLMMAGTTYGLRYFVIVPIQSMSRTLEAITKGNLGSRMPKFDWSDEIADLAHLIENVRQKLQETFADNEEKIRRQGILLENSRVFDTNVRTIIGNSSMDGAVAAVNELTASVSQITERTRMMGRNMDTNFASIKNLQEGIGALSSSVKEIEEVIGIVDGIASQTNLLALNASIEAARAGDAGRGFAVVADEVKKLAQQTSDQIVSISSRVEQMMVASANVKKATESMASTFTETSTLTKEIENSMDEQSRAMEDINNTLTEQGENVRNMQTSVTSFLQSIEA